MIEGVHYYIDPKGKWVFTAAYQKVEAIAVEKPASIAHLIMTQCQNLSKPERN
jgi:hypothetical protein